VSPVALLKVGRTVTLTAVNVNQITNTARTRGKTSQASGHLVSRTPCVEIDLRSAFLERDPGDVRVQPGGAKLILNLTFPTDPAASASPVPTRCAPTDRPRSERAVGEMQGRSRPTDHATDPTRSGRSGRRSGSGPDKQTNKQTL
jgi:hypothetical protein